MNKAKKTVSAMGPIWLITLLVAVSCTPSSAGGDLYEDYEADPAGFFSRHRGELVTITGKTTEDIEEDSIAVIVDIGGNRRFECDFNERFVPASLVGTKEGETVTFEAGVKSFQSDFIERGSKEANRNSNWVRLSCRVPLNGR